MTRQKIRHRGSHDMRAVMTAMYAVRPDQRFDGAGRFGGKPGRVVEWRYRIKAAMDHQKRALDLRRIALEVDALVELEAFFERLAVADEKQTLEGVLRDFGQIPEMIHRSPSNDRLDASVQGCGLRCEAPAHAAADDSEPVLVDFGPRLDIVDGRAHCALEIFPPKHGEGRLALPRTIEGERCKAATDAKVVDRQIVFLGRVEAAEQDDARRILYVRRQAEISWHFDVVERDL